MKVFTDPKGNRWTQDYYTYLFNAGAALAAAANATAVVPVEADSTFVLVKMAYFADIAGAAQTDSTFVVPLVTVSITDTGSGRNLQQNPVPIDAIAGRGQLPFVLPVPREFQANSSIQCTFSNFSAATTYANLRLMLIGYKKYFLSQVKQ